MAGGFEHLVSEGVIAEVLGRLKSGKEADVYMVRYGGRIVAAKVYKDRAQRSFKNNSAYMEGRTVRNTRSQRAMSRKTAFGQAASEAAWKSAEADALYKLHAADVRVPTPVMFLEGVLFMELVLGEDGEPAPRLIDTDLTAEQANAAYHDMLGQLVRILSCDLIHGDLSPYNVLWGAAGPTIIDFPQIISASHNSRSEAFFLRAARNSLGHFASIDRSLNARASDPGGDLARLRETRALPRFRPPRAPARRAPRPSSSRCSARRSSFGPSTPRSCARAAHRKRRLAARPPVPTAGRRRRSSTAAPSAGRTAQARASGSGGHRPCAWIDDAPPRSRGCAP